MKLVIAMGLLVTMAGGQTPVQPVKTESQASSLTVTSAGAEGSSYHVKVTNTSSYAVTAFALRLVPSGVPLVNGHYACEGACQRIIRLADSARPAIKAGGVADFSVPVSRVNGGDVSVEAAIFADESYEGEDRAAAFLVAQQIGRQAEYGRLIAAVSSAMFTNADDAHKTAQIRIKLGEVSVNLEPAMVRTFKLWFPNLGGCSPKYARFMKAAAVHEKSLVTTSMEQFAHGTAPGKPSLAQWWASMQQFLGDFGCNGCQSPAMRPRAHPSEQNVSKACTDDVTPILLAAADDDGSQAGVAELEEDLEMEAALSDEDEAALDGDILMPDVRMPSRPPANVELIAPKVEPPANAGVPLPRTPVAAAFPSGIPLILAQDGGRLLFRSNLGERPVPDNALYRLFFRDLSSYGDMALYEEVRWDAQGNRVENQGPRAGGLNKPEIAVLQQVAKDASRQLTALQTKRENLLLAKLAGYPGGWIVNAPPIPELHALEIEETQTLNTAIHRLKLQLGPTSSTRLDVFLRNVYRATPGKMVRTPLTDDMRCARFFTYLAALDPLAERNLLAKKEETTRQHELHEVGLADKDFALLLKVAKDYHQLSESLYSSYLPPGSVAMGTATATAVSPAPSMGAVQALTPEQLRLLAQLREKRMEAAKKNVPPSIEPTFGVTFPRPGPPGMAIVAGGGMSTLSTSGGAVVGGAVGPGASSDELAAHRKEMERKHDELNLALITGIAELQASFGQPGYQKFQVYLRQIYAHAGFEVGVPIEAKAPEQAKK